MVCELKPNKAFFQKRKMIFFNQLKNVIYASMETAFPRYK